MERLLKYHKKGGIKIFALFFFLFSFFLNGWTTTYYVDATNGNNTNNGLSALTPWKTIFKVNSSTFCAGDNILFKKGGRWTNETITVPSSGSIGNPITFGAYGTGAKPIIDVRGSKNVGIYSNQKNYITVDGFNIIGWKKRGIHAYRCDNWIIQNNTVSGGTNKHTVFGIQVQGTNADYSKNTRILNNTIEQVGLGDNNASHLNAGIDAEFTDNVTINNNYVATVHVTGITARGYINEHSSTTAIRSNKVTNFYGVGIIVTETKGAVDVSYNHVHNGFGAGIALNYSIQGPTVTYNLVHDLTALQYQFNGIDFNTGVTNGLVYNNTIYKVGQGCLTIETDCTGNIIKNNILDSSKNNDYLGNGLAYGIYTPDLDGNSGYDYNLYNPPTSGKWAGKVVNLGNSPKTLAEWRTQLNIWGETNKEIHSIQADPKFANVVEGDFHLLSTSPAINAGTNVSLTTDYAGKTIPLGSPPDIGAFKTKECR